VNGERSTVNHLPARALLTGVVALVVGFVVLALGLALGGYDPVLSLGALWRGAFGSWYAITSATLVRAVPLIILGLGIALAFRAGVFNIGAEGQFYAGAIAATWVGLHVAAWPSIAAIGAVWIAAAIAGALWIVVPVLLKVRFGVIEVISTLLLNFIAEAVVSFAVTGPLQEVKRIYPQSDPIADAARLPVLPGSRLHAGFLVALLLAILLWLLFTRTAWGFRLRAVGLGPRAAEVSGRIPTRRVVAIALLWSGALAGLGGGVEISGVTYALFQNLSPGYGFTAIAVALLARLHPLGVVLTGILFGALEAGAQGMQREAGVPAVAVQVAEAVVILVIVLADVLSRRMGVGGWSLGNRRASAEER
jgi:general nucleoside transport system permease protein